MFKLNKMNKLCRKYRQDIFGMYIKKRKVNKVMAFLIKIKYEKYKRKPFCLDVLEKLPAVRKFSYKKRPYFRNLLIRKLVFFSGGLRKKTFKAILKKASTPVNFFLNKFFSYLEFRLCLIVYRMNFCSTILEAMQYIYAGFILVNKEVIKNVNFVVGIGDIIELLGSKRHAVLLKLKQRALIFKSILWQPHFLLINYSLLCCIVIQEPNAALMKYPFKMNSKFGYMLKVSKY